MEKQVGIEELLLSPRRRDRRTPGPSAALLALVREFGPVLPVIVRQLAPQRYEILSNAETWLAAQRLGFHKVSIVIRPNVSDEQADALLGLKAQENPIQKAQRYAQWLDTLPDSGSHGAIAALARLEGCSRSHVAHFLRILNLPELVQRAIQEGLLNLGQAKALAGVASTEQQIQIATSAIRGRWSVRQTEDAVRKGTMAGQGRAVEVKDPQTRRLERRLGEQLGSPVNLDMTSGHLVIDYRKDLGVLNGLLERLGYRAE